MSGLLFPVVGNARISSTYGGRSSPGGIGSTNHRGVDIAAPLGSQVIAPTDMKIISAGRAGGFGNLIVGQDNAGNTYQFGHLSGMNVSKGQVVGAGSTIGAVGSTGNSTGNHLHFGVKDKSGKYIDPVKAGLNIGKDAVKSAGKAALDTGKSALKGAVGSVLGGAISGGPAGAGLAVANEVLGGVLGTGGIGGLLGGGGGSSWVDEIRDWLKSSGFFQRIALAFFAFVLLAGAVYMMKSGTVAEIVKGK